MSTTEALIQLYPRQLAHPLPDMSIDAADVIPRQHMMFYRRAVTLKYKVGQRLKRAVDFLLALAGLLVISPLLVGIVLLIRLTSPGPVFYHSVRIGKNSEPFYMYKFRTMCTDADAKRDQLRSEAQLEGQLFKLKNDPRITPIGRFLRAFSLDELPQLINVLIGDMSLVGPRPLPADESILFKAPYTLRFNVLPGVTGSWQVAGRSNLGFDQLCALELDYILHWNIWKDIGILCKTVPTVLFSKGAC